MLLNTLGKDERLKTSEIPSSFFIIRVAKYFAEIERGDIVRQTDFCLAFFEVLTERERNDEVDVAFAKFIGALGCPLFNTYHSLL